MAQAFPSLDTLSQLLIALLQSTLPEKFAILWKHTRKLWRGWAEEGMYEVLDYEFTLELQDKRGEKAIVRKRERVKYLQNNIIAYQDQAWGDGQILVNYRCTPGVAVDQYRPAQKTFILISLREVKKRCDEDEFQMTWEMHGSFTRPTELWSAEISHRTRRLKLQVIFPASRPPLKTTLIEQVCRRVAPLHHDRYQRLPDGRTRVSWETAKPQLYETYAIQWEW